MKAWHLAWLATLVALTLPAGEALARRAKPSSKTQVAVAPLPVLPHSGYDLADSQTAPAKRVMAARKTSRPSLRNRASVPMAPAADPWALLPSPSMTYQAGQRGPVIQVGPFGSGMQPLRKERAARRDGALAHVKMAWRF